MNSVALLNIGTELLRGRTVNTNASEMGQMLGLAGYSLDRTEVIHDTYDTIAQAIERLMGLHEVVLVTGGLGPTKDDITKKVLLDIFGGEMVLNEPMMEQIKDFYRRLGREMNDLNVMQAMVPSSCQVLHNSRGTAPGMMFERDGKVLIAMPGVPFEMRHLMRKQVIPTLNAKYPAEFMVAKIVRTHGLPESKLAEKMEAFEDRLPAGLEIAYLPSLDGTKMELKLRGKLQERDDLEGILSDAQIQIATYLEKYVYGLEDKFPDQILTDLLSRRKITLATAESCTGGLISAKMVQNSGVSAVHKGGVVAYATEMKEKILGVPHELIETHGVVSEEVALAMAIGVRNLMGTDVAISITGYAEGDLKGSEEDAPQAWIAVADANGAFARHIKFFHGRKTNIERAAFAAIIMCLRHLQQF